MITEIIMPASLRYDKMKETQKLEDINITKNSSYTTYFAIS